MPHSNPIHVTRGTTAPDTDEGQADGRISWLDIADLARAYRPDELLVRATGRPLTAAPYLAYLDGKHRELYSL